MSKKSLISVIIPTYKDWKRLQICVNALANQSLSPEKFEILIINNESRHHVPIDFKAPSNLIFLHEAKSGSYAARNKGIKQAKGGILAFTDSDCIPEKDWLKNAIKLFENQDVQRIAGKIELFYKNSKRKTWAELYESVFAFNQKENVEIRKLSVTANFFTRKEMFSLVGLFDSSKMSGEDWGWNRRATALGASIDYASHITVFHPARYKTIELVKKTKRVVSGIELNKSVIKKLAVFPYLILNNLLKPLKKIFLDENLSASEKIKVTNVVFYLYLVYFLEYCKLLLNLKSKR